jgi:hypothetical protein
MSIPPLAEPIFILSIFILPISISTPAVAETIFMGAEGGARGGACSMRGGGGGEDNVVGAARDTASREPSLSSSVGNDAYGMGAMLSAYLFAIVAGGISWWPSVRLWAPLSKRT